MKVMLVLLLGLTAALPENASGDGSTKDTRRVNKYYESFNFICPDHQSISLIISQHDDGYKDELWELGCKKAFSELSLCNWTDDIGVLNEQWQFACLDGKVITGMDSYFDLKKKERRWKYYCCSGGVRFDYDCQWSEYVNSFDAYMRWEAPTHYYLVGIASFHDKLNWKRRWQYRYCAM
ncbi:hemagglutinin/amebocyte aggregation factor-like isoform X2 [Ascaphus truei]|uniref:hemagglutinin/amebocyte aggregation factor-like isoform X2 n=1 Tax=Ascaphus truei TaxID=8439 RepID=UPI003F592905